MKIIRPLTVTDGGSFTRASTGTYYDSAGVLRTAAINTPRFNYNPYNLAAGPSLLMEAAATNYAMNTESAADWSACMPVQVPAAFFGLTGVQITVNTALGDNPYKSGDTSSLPAGTFTYSLFVDVSTRTVPTDAIVISGFAFDAGGVSYSESSFNPATGVMSVANTAGNATHVAHYAIQYTSTIWRLVKVVSFSQTTNTRRLYTYLSTVLAKVTVGLPQIETGNKATSYIPTTSTFVSRASTGTYYDAAGVLQTAAINVARTSYDPASLSSPTLLLENAATNLVVGSSDLTAAGWQRVNSTVAANTTLAPDGTTTADSVTCNGPAGNSWISYPFGTLVGAYTFSVYIKTADSVVDIGGGNSKTNVTYTITSVGGGWYRHVVSFNITSGSCVPLIAPPQPVFPTTYQVWGAQFETGYGATSYIPTTTATVTRAADFTTFTATTRAADVNTTMLISNVPENDYAAWNSGTAYAKGNRVLDLTTHLVYEAIVGSSAVVGISTATPGVVTWTNHGLPAGTIVQFSNSGGSLPTGISPATNYYVQNPTSGTFQISLTNGGALISTISGGGSGTQTCTATNTARPLSDTTAWIVVGSDNRWRMFDQSVSSQTSQATSVCVALTPGTRIDSIVGMNCSAVKATINVVDPTDGLVYSKTVPLVSDSGITDMFEYFFEPVVQLPDFILTDLPVAYASSSTVTVCITGTTAAIGCLIIGLSKEVGVTVEGAKVGIVDYGIKQKDTFGNYTILQRGYSKRADFSIKVATSDVDTLQAMFASYRSTPIVYVGSNAASEMQFQSTVIYGYYKDFSIDIAYPPYSTCSLQVEGLT